MRAFLFPGQGSQRAGLRELVDAAWPELAEAAAEAVGEDPFERLAEGTMYVQPVVYCASLALWRARKDGPPPAAYAGHSLGEISALACAGALDPFVGLDLVALRGRLTQEATREESGGMLAVRSGAAQLDGHLTDGLAIANENSPEQTVVSGPIEPLERLREEMNAAGIRATRLHIDGAFHNPSMAAAGERLRAALDATAFASPNAPVYSCVTASPFDDIRRELAASLTHTVRWLNVLGSLEAAGIDSYEEVGPGRALTGLVSRTLSAVQARSWDELDA